MESTTSKTLKGDAISVVDTTNAVASPEVDAWIDLIYGRHHNRYNVIPLPLETSFVKEEKHLVVPNPTDRGSCSTIISKSQQSCQFTLTLALIIFTALTAIFVGSHKGESIWQEKGLHQNNSTHAFINEADTSSLVRTSRSRLLLNVALGDTGSTSMHEAICSLGVPSIHYNRCCTPRVIPVQERAPLRAHNELLAGYKEVRECVNGGDKSCIENVEVWASHMRDHADAIASSRQDLYLSDTPYPSIARYLVESSQRNVGVRPNLIMTERDPHAWAVRRPVAHRKKDQDVLCKEDVEDFLDAGTMDKDPFDMFHCIDRAQQRYGPKRVLGVKDVFTAFRKISPNEKTRLETMAMAMRVHQDMWRPSVDYATNMFEREVFVNSSTLAGEVTASIDLSSFGDRSEIMYVCRVPRLIERDFAFRARETVP